MEQPLAELAELAAGSGPWYQVPDADLVRLTAAARAVQFVSCRSVFRQLFRQKWSDRGNRTADGRLRDIECLADFRLRAIMTHVGQSHLRVPKTYATRRYS